MGTKANAAEQRQRVNEVMQMLAEGASRPEILEFAGKKWEISRASTDNLIKRANGAFAAEAETIREAELGRALRRLNTIFAKSMKVQDYRVAISAQKEINSLLALYQKTPLELPLGDQILLAQLLALLADRQINASKVFNAMIAQIAAGQEQQADDN